MRIEPFFKSLVQSQTKCVEEFKVTDYEICKCKCLHDAKKMACQRNPNMGCYLKTMYEMTSMNAMWKIIKIALH